MNRRSELDGIAIEADTDAVSPIHEGALLTGGEVTLGLPCQPDRCCRNGWQSWSLTRLHRTGGHAACFPWSPFSRELPFDIVPLSYHIAATRQERTVLHG
jgi:hypothetical protein